MQMRLSLLVAVVLFAAAGQVNATLVQFDFTGIASSVPDPFNNFGGNVNVGDSFSGSFAYDLSTPDIQPAPSAGFYVQSPVTTASFSAAVGPLSFQTEAGTDFKVTVIDGSSDELLISSTLLDSTGDRWITEWRVGYNPGAAGPFSNDSLPTSLDLADFNIFLSFRLSAESPSQPGLYGDALWGSLETLTAVPEPSTLALAAFGFVGMIALGRRRQRSRVA